MSELLLRAFESVAPLPKAESVGSSYSVVLVPTHQCYYVGKDMDSKACLLIAGSDASSKQLAPIRLENLDVQFDLRCRIHRGHESPYPGRFTVVRCRTGDRGLIRYFFSVCEVVLQILGENPEQYEVAEAISRIATIFQNVSRPAQRSLTGLFGELFLIRHCLDPVSMISAWRIDESARFDFARDQIRLESKATSGRIHAHTFSYDQCNPPPGIDAFVGSMLAEQVATGTSLSELVDQIEDRVSGNSDAVFKLRDTVAATLGTSLAESLVASFDTKLTESSLLFYRLSDVPAIRGHLPIGVSDVHFRSDLATTKSRSIAFLAKHYPGLAAFLPG